MDLCSNWGEELNESSRFCPYCGSRVAIDHILGSVPRCIKALLYRGTDPFFQEGVSAFIEKREQPFA